MYVVKNAASYSTEQHQAVKALAKREAAVAAGWTRQTTQTNDISAAIQKLTVLKVTVTAQVKFC